MENKIDSDSYNFIEMLEYWAQLFKANDVVS